jgi:hypothetical protein
MNPINRRQALRSLGILYQGTFLSSCCFSSLAADAVPPRDRERAIRYSDVVFAFEFTPAEYKMWHANKLYGWCGRVQSKEDIQKFIQKKDAALAVGVKMGSSLNAFAGESEWYAANDPKWQEGLWRDANGNFLTYPWVRPPDPFPPEKGVICTNHPLFLKKKFEEVDLAIGGKPDCFHLDDPLGTATVLRGSSPGCFCRYCLAGFRDYLKANVSPEKIRSAGISNIDVFDYSERLRANIRSCTMTLRCWRIIRTRPPVAR